MRANFKFRALNISAQLFASSPKSLFAKILLIESNFIFSYSLSTAVIIYGFALCSALSLAPRKASTTEIFFSVSSSRSLRAMLCFLLVSNHTSRTMPLLPSLLLNSPLAVILLPFSLWVSSVVFKDIDEIPSSFRLFTSSFSHLPSPLSCQRSSSPNLSSLSSITPLLSLSKSFRACTPSFA